MKVAVLGPDSSHAGASASIGDGQVGRRASTLLVRSQLMGRVSPVPATRKTSHEGND